MGSLILLFWTSGDILRFTFGVTPAHLLVVSMEAIQSTYLQTSIGGARIWEQLMSL